MTDQASIPLETPAPVVPPAGLAATESFSGEALERTAETATAAVAAQARAQVEARYIVAMKRPRDIEEVRVRLLKECKRPGFAQVARYRKPIGQGVEGPSIRFAEAALRLMGNMLAETSTVYDDAEKRIVRVSVTDLETNFTHPKDIVIHKSVERRDPKKGQKVYSSRVNSTGERVYQVEATDDDLLNKENALVSKALRTGALRMLPGDILEECMTSVMATLRDRAAKDPDAERKALSDAFAALNVMPSDLKVYLGHDLGQTSPAELVELRGVYQALKDGEASWKDVLESKGASGNGDAGAGGKTTTESIKDKVKASTKGREPGQEG